MCGRYQYSMEQPTLREIWEQAQARFPNCKMEVGEIFPTNTVPVLLEDVEGIIPAPVKWGFPGFGGKGVIINARSETAAEKRMFSECIRSQRCAVPTSGFFEWSHGKDKTKYRFFSKPNEVLYLAGLWQEFEDERRFVIFTGAANASMADIHDRMPIMLREEDVGLWIRDSACTGEFLLQPAPSLIREEQGYVQQSLC